MTQTAIPYLFIRGGTSRGPYFRRDDLPANQDKLAEVLIAALGAGHPINIDGIGGGNAVTTKVAMLSVSNDPWADVDYFFAQVAVDGKSVDFKPTCGNILSGVGPAAIEMGLVPITGDITEVKIRAVNTNAQVVAKVQTPNGALNYEGDTEIDGVPGSSAPIQLGFRGVAGSVTGAFLPTGNLIDTIDGVEVTFMDVAMPVVIARAEDLGVTGYESVDELDGNAAFFARIESIRQKAGQMIGMKNVEKSVTPKFAILAPARHGNTIATRYFMPWATHPSMAVTGGQCIATCALTPGTVSDGLANRPKASPAAVVLEHASGTMDVLIEYDLTEQFEIKSAGLVRTARKLADGCLYIPDTIWKKPSKG